MMAKHYQYVLIGSGVAAVTLAKQLLENDRATSILMLEAGPEGRARRPAELVGLRPDRPQAL